MDTVSICFGKFGLKSSYSQQIMFFFLGGNGIIEYLDGQTP